MHEDSVNPFADARNPLPSATVIRIVSAHAYEALPVRAGHTTDDNHERSSGPGGMVLPGPSHPERTNMSDDVLRCPFTYANGCRCQGTVYRARAYGRSRGWNYPERDDVHKYRLWCSVKGDHAGAVSSFVSKDRMEFYPDRLPATLIDRLWQGDLLS